MSMFYSRRRRSQSFGSYGSYKDQKAIERPSLKPELIEGYAHLCFDQQGLWFRGIMLTTDGTSYSLSGKRIRLGLPEEQTERSTIDISPDVIRDFPSPLRSDGSVDMKEASSSVTPDDGPLVNSRQNSMDGRIERELQFILEEIPLTGKAISPCESTGSLPISRPGSPPTNQQIIKALDNLLIHDSESVMEEPDANQESLPSTPFRSRSGSRSQMEMVTATFDVTISDLEDGTQHHIRSVSGRNGNTCTFRNRQLCFATDRSFWGQRADMVIQKQLAAPDLVGQGCHVFAGPMRFYYNPLGPEPSSFTNNWCW